MQNPSARLYFLPVTTQIPSPIQAKSDADDVSRTECLNEGTIETLLNGPRVWPDELFLGNQGLALLVY